MANQNTADVTLMAARTDGGRYDTRRGRWTRVSVSTAQARYTGKLWVPEQDMELGEVLSEPTSFLTLFAAQVDGEADVYPVLAVGKAAILTAVEDYR